MPYPKRLAEWRNVPELEDIPRWVTWDADRVVATSGVYLHRTQDLENAWSWIYVSVDYRNRGLSRPLARMPVEYAFENGRKRIAVGLPEGSEYSVLPGRAGMKMVYNERVSQLRISDLDFEMLEQWVARAPERAGDYELLFLPTPIPEEHRTRMIEVMDVMNTAPLEDLEEEPTKWDDEMLRDVEAADARKQNTICRWLKAAMALKFLAEHPDVKVIETNNADSNDPMLHINVAMGFKPAWQHIIYQGEFEPVIEYLNE
jgi:hypothetical protein